jgi:hypothetical protein
MIKDCPKRTDHFIQPKNPESSTTEKEVSTDAPMTEEIEKIAEEATIEEIEMIEEEDTTEETEEIEIVEVLEEATVKKSGVATKEGIRGAQVEVAATTTRREVAETEAIALTADDLDRLSLYRL